VTCVVLPGALRQYSGGESTIDIRFDQPSTLGELLDELDRRCPRLAGRIRDEQGQLRRYVNVYVDRVDARELGGVCAPVDPAAEVLVLPSVAGG
jgi:molybdopterin converting factor small subunit